MKKNLKRTTPAAAASSSSSSSSSSSTHSGNVKSQKKQQQLPYRNRKMLKRSTNRTIEISGLDFQPKLPETFESEAYEKIDTVVDDIFNKRAPTISFEEIHSDVDTLCAYGKSADLYNSIVKTCRSHISSQVDNIRK